ncbi:hypothetical protein GGR50DRAFT_408455 [Xylaria sp. CBS 124048]|nr:hypothetical protein GGR50DRAFT_408455 [Xylaria sp. CBS 124048]
MQSHPPPLLEHDIPSSPDNIRTLTLPRVHSTLLVTLTLGNPVPVPSLPSSSSTSTNLLLLPAPKANPATTSGSGPTAHHIGAILSGVAVVVVLLLLLWACCRKGKNRPFFHLVPFTFFYLFF